MLLRYLAQDRWGSQQSLLDRRTHDLQTMKSHKKPNKLNKKIKQEILMNEDSGILSQHNKELKRPIVSIPEIVTSPTYLQYRRFINNGGAIAGALAISDLLNQFCVATTTVLVYPYVRAIRIKKIRLLSPVTQQGTSVTLSLLPVAIDTGNNSFNSVPELYVDTSASIDVPAYLSLTPSTKTPLGSWHFNTTVNGNLLQITCPAGTTMDILFEYVLNLSALTPTYSRTISSGFAGTLYAAPILTNFLPVGVNYV